jgi:hypothetical protein
MTTLSTTASTITVIYFKRTTTTPAGFRLTGSHLWQHSGKVLDTPSSPRKHTKLFENASSDTKRRTKHSRESAIIQLNYALGYLQQEALTSVITASGIFPHPPHIVGNSWTGLGLEWKILKAPPAVGINRPDDVVSALIRDTAKRLPTAEYLLQKPFGSMVNPGTSSGSTTTRLRTTHIRQIHHPNHSQPLTVARHDTRGPHGSDNIASGKTEYQSEQATPWSHNTLIVLREVRAGALRDVWPKIQGTQQAGKRVLLVLQDQKTENKKHSRTQEFFHNINGTVVAWFPTKTITHATGLTHEHLGKEIATRGYSKTVTKFDLSPTFITREPHEHEPCPFHTFSCKQ